MTIHYPVYFYLIYILSYRKGFDSMNVYIAKFTPAFAGTCNDDSIVAMSTKPVLIGGYIFQEEYMDVIKLKRKRIPKKEYRSSEFRIIIWHNRFVTIKERNLIYDYAVDVLKSDPRHNSWPKWKFKKKLKKFIKKYIDKCYGDLPDLDSIISHLNSIKGEVY